MITCCHNFTLPLWKIIIKFTFAVLSSNWHVRLRSLDVKSHGDVIHTFLLLLLGENYSTLVILLQSTVKQQFQIMWVTLVVLTNGIVVRTRPNSLTTWEFFRQPLVRCRNIWLTCNKRPDVLCTSGLLHHTKSHTDVERYSRAFFV